MGEKISNLEKILEKLKECPEVKKILEEGRMACEVIGDRIFFCPPLSLRQGMNESEKRGIECGMAGDQIFFKSPSFLAQSAIEKEMARIIGLLNGPSLRHIPGSPDYYYFEWRTDFENINKTESIIGILMTINSTFAEYKNAITKIADLLLFFSSETVSNRLVLIPDKVDLMLAHAAGGLGRARVITSDELLSAILSQIAPQPKIVQ